MIESIGETMAQKYEDRLLTEKICPMSGDISDVTKTLEVLIEKINQMITLQRDVIKWLLIVVCVIALGRSGLDLGKELLKQAASSAATTAIAQGK